MQNRPLDGRVAIVTGAGRGIGRSVALTLAWNGACVALVARTKRELLDVRKEIEKAGGEATVFCADVSKEKEIVALVRGVLKRFKRLDILVNNAGVGMFGPLEKTSTRIWDEVMAVNARGPFLLCREAIPHLRKREESWIVNIASVVGIKGYSNQSVYSASKHAVMGMTKALGKEVQKDGIRVHAVCPGGVDTEMVARARPDIDRSDLMQSQEIADIVLFLVTRRGNAVIDQIDVRRKSSLPWA